MVDDVLARVIEWAEATEPVRVVLLTSSRTTPTATLDQFSDYDVIIAVTDVHPFFENREWLKSFGEVLAGCGKSPPIDVILSGAKDLPYLFSIRYSRCFAALSMTDSFFPQPAS